MIWSLLHESAKALSRVFVDCRTSGLLGPSDRESYMAEVSNVNFTDLDLDVGDVGGALAPLWQARVREKPLSSIAWAMKGVLPEVLRNLWTKYGLRARYLLQVHKILQQQLLCRHLSYSPCLYRVGSLMA